MVYNMGPIKTQNSNKNKDSRLTLRPYYSLKMTVYR